MPQHSRIRRLRLSCPSRDSAHPALVRLSDAFRTASLGDDSRLFCVRRLDLGPLPASASPTTWSLRLEQRFRQLAPKPVPPTHPNAARANCVVFDHPLAPWRLLALRAALDTPCSEWFWPLVVPGWTPSLSQPQTLRLAFRQLASATPTQALALVLDLASHQRAAMLLDAITPADTLLIWPIPTPQARRLSPTSSPESNTPAPPSPQDPASPCAFTPPAWVRSLLATLPSNDPRAWLPIAAAFHAAGLPPRTPAELARLAPVWSGTPNPSARTHKADVSSSRSRPPQPPAPTPQSPPPPPPDHPSAPTLLEPANSTDAPPQTASDHPSSLDPTSAGGLFFLLPVLVRLGLPNLLTEHPHLAQTGLPWHILHAALALARLRKPDPLSSLPTPPIPPQHGTLAPILLRSHHLVRRLTDLTLPGLVRRPALVTLTVAHIDIFFRPKDADVRIRRAGLDLDPGWVPWLQRVVRFHFNRDG